MKTKYGNTFNQGAGESIDVSVVAIWARADKFYPTGVYVKVDDVSALEEAMTHAAATMNTNRNLLGYRACANLDILLGIMRVLFIAILGLVIALEKTILSERFLDTSSVLISSVVGSILAGLCIEIGMNTLGIHPTIMRMITCALIAFTLLKKDLRNRDEADGGVKYADR